MSNRLDILSNHQLEHVFCFTGKGDLRLHSPHQGTVGNPDMIFAGTTAPFTKNYLLIISLSSFVLSRATV